MQLCDATAKRRDREEPGDLLIDDVLPGEPRFYEVLYYDKDRKGRAVRSLETHGWIRFFSDERVAELEAKASLQRRKVDLQHLQYSHLRLLASHIEAWPEAAQFQAAMRETYCLAVEALVEGGCGLVSAWKRSAKEVYAQNSAAWRSELDRQAGRKDKEREGCSRRDISLLAPDEIVTVPKPGWLTVRRWWFLYRAAGKDRVVLIDRAHDRGRRMPDAMSGLKWNLDRPLCRHGAAFYAVETFYLGIANATKISAFRKYIECCEKWGLAPLSRQTFSRILERHYTAFEIYKGKWGEKSAYYRFGFFNRRPLPDCLLAEVEVDHTLLNIWVRRGGKLKAKRVWLTVFMDRASRCVLGFHLSFQSPSYDMLQKALIHALMPKDPTAYGARCDWPCHGVFRLVFTDRGADFLSQSFHKAMDNIGTEVINLPGGCPHLRGMIERFFRTVKAVVSLLPGGFRSTLKQPGSEQGSAKMTLEELERWLGQWIVDTYHQRKHRTLGCSPAERWQSLAATLTPLTLAEQRQMALTLGYKVFAKAQNVGIQWKGRCYQSQYLQELRMKFGTERKWQVRGFPTKSPIWLLDDTGRAPHWTPVFATDDPQVGSRGVERLPTDCLSAGPESKHPAPLRTHLGQLDSAASRLTETEPGPELTSGSPFPSITVATQVDEDEASADAFDALIREALAA